MNSKLLVLLTFCLITFSQCGHSADTPDVTADPPAAAPAPAERSVAAVLTANDTLPYPVYASFDEIEPLFQAQDDTVHVINFWATWCKPCVEELPYFERLAKEMEGQPVKIVMVSLDFKKDIATKLLDFVRNRPLTLPVVALTDSKYNNWIDRVDPEWGGAIPVTLIYKKGARFFVPEQFPSYAQLNEAVRQLL